jgi:hypothetical protein
MTAGHLHRSLDNGGGCAVPPHGVNGNSGTSGLSGRMG